jgi:hypothetical protein
VPIDRLDIPLMVLIALVLLFAGVRMKFGLPLWLVGVVILWIAGRRMRKARMGHEDRERAIWVDACIQRARRIRKELRQ